MTRSGTASPKPLGRAVTPIDDLGIGVVLMHRRSPLWLFGLLVLGSGCTLCHDAASLAVFKVRESMEDFSESVRNRKWAEGAWEDVQGANPDMAFTDDYAQGFKDGFAHYLLRGGNCEPPPLPPRHYRKLRYQTPEGYRAIEDWFAGFRYGANMARQNGYREWITGPSALRCPEPAALPPAAEPSPLVPAPPTGEVLPTPMTVPKETAREDEEWLEPKVFAVRFKFRFDLPPWLTGGRADP